MRKIDLTGQKFGRLKVLRQAENRGARVHWLCRCDCGNERPFQSGLLRSGHTKSCGCFDRELKLARLRAYRPETHGMTGHPLHNQWKGMLSRCSNPNGAQWKDYGGRGITVCERWQDFQNFRDDMIAGWRPGLTIERVNNDLGYSPDNCIWLARSEQSKNRRNCIWVETDRGRMIVAEASRISGLSHFAIRNRHFRGCPPDRILDKKRWVPNGKSGS